MYEQGVLVPALGRTAATFIVSLTLAIVAGVLAGVVIGASTRVERAFQPLMDIFRALPPPVIVPVVGLVIGPTFQAGVIIVALAVVWPILLNTTVAMRTIPAVRLEMARTLGLSNGARFLKVVLPSLLGGIAAGVKLAVSISLIVTLLVDILGAGEGVGRLLVDRQQAYDAAAVWGLLAVIGIFGAVVNIAVDLVVRWLLNSRRGGRN
jgi:ABC-type nitrate/sulfonate/bicarbonate transport system permease component